MRLSRRPAGDSGVFAAGLAPRSHVTWCKPAPPRPVSVFSVPPFMLVITNFTESFGDPLVRRYAMSAPNGALRPLNVPCPEEMSAPGASPYAYPVFGANRYA